MGFVTAYGATEVFLRRQHGVRHAKACTGDASVPGDASKRHQGSRCRELKKTVKSVAVLWKAVDASLMAEDDRW